MTVTAHGVDCGYGPPTGAQLAAADIDFLAGYLRKAEPSSIHVLTGQIVADMHATGRRLVLLYEDTDPAFMLTRSGITHARQAVADVAALGIPLRAVYFCCDTDASPDEFGNVARFLREAAAVLSVDRVGCYGKAALIDYVRGQPSRICTWFMQSGGWDHGEQADGIHIRQTLHQTQIGGITVDLDEALALDYGQWPPPPPPPPAYTDPTPGADMSDADVTAVDQHIDRAVRELETDTTSGHAIANLQAHMTSQGNRLAAIETTLGKVFDLLTAAPTNPGAPAVPVSAGQLAETPAPRPTSAVAAPVEPMPTTPPVPAVALAAAAVELASARPVKTR